MTQKSPLLEILGINDTVADREKLQVAQECLYEWRQGLAKGGTEYTLAFLKCHDTLREKFGLSATAACEVMGVEEGPVRQPLPGRSLG